MSGFDETNSGWTGVKTPSGLPHPTRKATNTSTAPFVYSRRYLDWNRYTFQYHAIGKQDAAAFDLDSGRRVTAEISYYREQQKLGKVYGCVPDFYCLTCVAFGTPNSLYTILSDALSTVVVNPVRSSRARMVFAPTGNARFDMHKGPFTYDDNFVVSPYRNAFMYIPDVPYSLAAGLLAGFVGHIPRLCDTVKWTPC